MSAPIMIIRIMACEKASDKDVDSLDRNPVEWIFFQEGVAMGPPRSTTLEQLKDTIEQFSIPEYSRLVLVLPGDEIIFTRVPLPANQKRKRAQLVPFILEEHLNQNMTDVFFATEWLPSNDVGVAYLAKARMDYWLAVLEQQGIRPDVVHAEQMLLPWRTNHVFAICDEHKVLVRHDNWVSSVAPKSFAADWLERVVREEQAKLTGQDTLDVRILVQKDDESLSFAQSLLSRVQTELAVAPLDEEDNSAQEPMQPVVNAKIMGVSQPLTQILAMEAVRLITEHSSFQLLQGSYKAARRRRQGKYHWRLAAAAVGAFVVMELGYTTASYFAFENAYTDARQENVTLFKEAFPHVKRIRGSLARALSSEKAKSGAVSTNASFLSFIMAAGTTLSQAKGLDVKRLSFDAGQGALKVDLQVADYPTLESIQKQIEANSMQVKIDGANKDENGVSARLRITIG